MTIGEHVVTVYSDPGAGGWSAPIASNPYLTDSLAGWTTGPFGTPWVWNADGSASGASSMSRDPAYPVARTPAALYRLRATITLDKSSAVSWGLYYGIDPVEAWRGPFWGPAGTSTEQISWGGFTAGTHTIDVTLDPTGIDPKFLYLGPVIYTWGNDPALAFRITTLELTQRLSPGVDLSCLIDEVSINHGRDDSGSQPEASSATVTFTSTPADPLPVEVDVGASLVVSTVTPRGISERFVGRITDLSLGWDEAGEDTPDAGVGQLVAVGPLGDLGRRVVGDIPWPAELDGARVSRVIAAAGLTLDPLTSDPGTVQIIARDVDSTPALDAARDAATSASGVLWETKGGEIRYSDADHRRGTPSAVVLDACDLLVSPAWRRTTEGLVNAVSVGYGVVPEGGEQPRYVDSSPASITRWGRYSYTAETALAALVDAQAIGRLLLARNSSPVWVMAALPVDTLGLDDDQYAALLGLDLHALVTLTGLPAIGTAPTSSSLWVEGWREVLTYGGHEIELVVSGYCRTAPPPRWDDVNPATLWGGPIPTTRRNVLPNPALRVGGGLNSDGTVTMSTVDGKRWASTTGAFVQMVAPGIGGQHYAASLLIAGPPGTLYTFDTSDYTVGAYADPHTGTIPASGVVRVDGASRTPTAAGCSQVVVTLYTGSNSALRITEGVIRPVTGPDQTTGPYFDGSTPDTAHNDYRWDGLADASASTAIETATETRRNLSLDPFSNPPSGWYPNDSSGHTRVVSVPITGHPAGITTAVRTGPIGALVGLNQLASFYAVDGLGPETVRGIGVWALVPYPCLVDVFVGAGSRARTRVPANVWTWCPGGTPSSGYAVVYAYRESGVTAAGDTGLFTGSIAEAGVVPSSYFDGNTPDTASTEYAWTGTPGASASTQSALAPEVPGGLPPDLTWNGAACLGPPAYLGRWADQPATLRWDAIAPAKTWDTYQ